MSFFEDLKNKLFFWFKVYTAVTVSVTLVSEISFSQNAWCIYLYKNLICHLISRRHQIDILHRWELAFHHIPQINQFLFLSFLLLYYMGYLYLYSSYFRIIWFEGAGAYYTQKKTYFLSTLLKLNTMGFYLLFIFCLLRFFTMLLTEIRLLYPEPIPDLRDGDDYLITEYRKFHMEMGALIENHTREIWPIRLIWLADDNYLFQRASFYCAFLVLFLMSCLVIIWLMMLYQMSQTVALKRRLVMKRYTVKPVMAFILDYLLSLSLVILFYIIEIIDWIVTFIPEFHYPLSAILCYLAFRLILVILHL